MYKPEREQALAKTALALMGECGVIATPENFELFYAYASGENPAITQAMGTLISARRPFTPEILLDLRLRCLSGARAARAMEDLGANMRGVIDDVLGKLEASARDTSNYKDALSAATGELGAERSPADLRALVDRLVAATRAMEVRTRSLEGELQASSEQVSELRSKLDNVRKESMTDPLTGIANRKAFDDAMYQALDQIAEARRIASASAQEARRAASTSRLLTLRAPVDGTVQQLAVHTLGGVVPAAQPIMQIVPSQGPLEVEAFIENKDKGFVRPGQSAAVKVDTFEYTKYGTLPGKVTHVSQDAIPDEKRGLIYAVKVLLDETTLDVQGVPTPITPGMAVSVEIKTGDRRVIEYVMSPLIRHTREAMRER